MPLSKQIHLYAVDTGSFYTDEENKTHWKLQYYKRKYRQLKAINTADKEDFYLEKLNRIQILLRSRIKDTKAILTRLFSENTDPRFLRQDALYEKNIISVFESALTRTLALPEDQITESLFVVQVYYFQILEDILLNGFYHQNEKYIFFTASAGQIRTKKTVFIKESLWQAHQKTLMCGLTLEQINQRGGVNVNKYMAYLALTNSATDPLEGFDIRKAIVVEDFESLVPGEVDYIDDETYQIERKQMEIPITHTDGCGMVLPKASKKNFMIRLPWLKGLMAVFPYTKFLREHKKDYPDCHIVRDIYGQEHDLLHEDIQMIFTKSQFKMWSFYSSWEEYISSFEACGCEAAICNVEEDQFPNARLNYQMLQTLTDIREDEILQITEKSRDTIRKIATDPATMLRVFGVVPGNRKKTPLQQALEMYPELLTDNHVRETLKQIKKSLLKEYRSGKLEVNGKYTFILPDLYAFCEHLFLKQANPAGLLNDGEVFCRLYKFSPKLDCLRSPHLYREHAVRNNIVDEEKKRWFKTDGLYTSSHDLISKLLQFDNDGDKALVCADETLIRIAERNMEGIVPLYYAMKKAASAPVTGIELNQGLQAAFTGSNIGVISNYITKVWNSPNPEQALDIIKLLCMENNFVIDYAKTLYKPKRPPHIHTRISGYTKRPLPHFFLYAKDKTFGQVNPVTGHIVDRLEELIPNTRLHFKKEQTGVFRYRWLMNRLPLKTDPELIRCYQHLSRSFHFRIRKNDGSHSNIDYIITSCRDELLSYGYSESDTADMLIRHLFKDTGSRTKELLWACFGSCIVENLKKNIGSKKDICKKCGTRFQKTAANQQYCSKCTPVHSKGTRQVICCDCQISFQVDARNTTKIRCDACQKEYRREQNRQYVRKYRSQACV